MEIYPEVSVIITTYKRPEKLGRSIRSVLSQTFKNWELLVVDDNDEGSSFREETEAFMAPYLLQNGGSPDGRIKYIKHEKNMGAPEARNTGIKNSAGEYIAFLDDDDEFLPEKLEEQLRLFKTSQIPDLGVVYCKNKYADEDGRVIRYSVARIRGDVLKYHLVRNIGITSTLMIKKEAIEKAGYFRSILCAQEYDLLLRIFALGYRADFVDEYLSIVYIHGGERITTGEKIIKGRLDIFEEKKKYFYLLSHRERRNVEHAHYLSMMREYILIKDRSKAWSFFIKAVVTKPFDILSYIEALTFVFPVKAVNDLKKYLHRFRKTVQENKFSDFSF